jgi:hypothetical protein
LLDIARKMKLRIDKTRVGSPHKMPRVVSPHKMLIHNTTRPTTSMQLVPPTASKKALRLNVTIPPAKPKANPTKERTTLGTTVVPHW